MKIPFISNSRSITLTIDGRMIKITSDDCRFNEITMAALDNDADAIMLIIDQGYKSNLYKEMLTEIAVFDKMTFSEGRPGEITVTYLGTVLPKVLSDKFVNLFKAGCTDFSHYYRFIERVFTNPNPRIREELYRFMEAADLPISQDGNFVAYKGVNSDLYSCTGNTNTRVLQGEVNSSGQILNELGAVIEVMTEDVDDNCENYCSTGLHVGSYGYASKFGHTVVAIEVDPRDVVSVPTDCGSQKCRVSKYRVLNILEREFDGEDVNVDDESACAESVEREERVIDTGAGTAKVQQMLSASNISNTRAGIQRNIEAHGGETTLNQLTKSVGRKYLVTNAEMLTVVLRLGYDVTCDSVLGKTTVRE